MPGRPKTKAKSGVDVHLSREPKAEENVFINGGGGEGLEGRASRRAIRASYRPGAGAYREGLVNFGTTSISERRGNAEVFAFREKRRPCVKASSVAIISCCAPRRAS